MFKNREMKKLLIIELIVLLLFLFITIISNANIHRKYQHESFKNTSKIIGYITSKYPDLEDDIIEGLITGDEQIGTDFLKKYGFYESNYFITNKFIYFNIVLLFIMAFVLVLINILFNRKQYRQIRGIDDYIYKILNDDFSFDIRQYNEGDISNLKNNIYKVMNKLKSMGDLALEDKKNLAITLSDISHQIKTPLTSLYVLNDMLETDVDDNMKHELLYKNKQQLERIEWLISSLLKISRLDSGMVELNELPINLFQLIKETIEPIEIMAELKNVKIDIKIDKKVTIIGDFKWLSEAFINIIKNAYEHTSENGLIRIVATDNLLYTQIDIEDNGEGIKAKDLKHIFERFYKGNSNKKSIGIGLNMAKTIIEKQNGFIEVESIGKKEQRLK